MRQTSRAQEWARAEPAGPVPQRDFEGLFGNVLRPGGAFAAGLREVGYDPEQPRERYPLAVWRAALEVARRHAHPGLSTPLAYRALGRQFVQGFGQTVVGTVFAAAAPLIGAERVLVRLPAYLRAGRDDMRLELRALGPRRWQAQVEDPQPLPEFVAGVIEEVLGLTGVEPRVQLLVQGETHYTLAVSWAPEGGEAPSAS